MRNVRCSWCEMLISEAYDSGMDVVQLTDSVVGIGTWLISDASGYVVIEEHPKTAWTSTYTIDDYGIRNLPKRYIELYRDAIGCEDFN